MLILLSNTGDSPLYAQIIDQIKTKILAGDLRPGDPLPSIRQLASELLISVITTKRAYQELESMGLIETRPGIGTFVAHNADLQAPDRRLQEIGSQLRTVIANARRLGLSDEQVRELLDAHLVVEDDQR